MEIQKEARTAAKTEKKPSIRTQLAQDKEALKNAPKKAAEKLKKLTKEEFAGLVFLPAEDME
ncbi:hypothetical protein D3Z50_22175 [Clostridiaceae bacterium]|nr:hypothetical protein [Clostridiaceae bacterium]